MRGIAQAIIYILEALFAAGIVGSALVILLTSVEDFEVFFSRDRVPSTDQERAVDGEEAHG